MPDEIYGVMAVKNGQKQTIMNLSNARQKSYADLQTMTDAQKKGVIVCPDYPKEEFLVTADEVSYGSGTVKDALDGLASIKSTKTITDPTIGSITFTLFKNGIKGVLVQSSGVPSSAYTSTAIIPSAYLPQTNFFVVGSTWVNAKYRRFSLISDGRVQVGASDENGLAVTGFYM